MGRRLLFATAETVKDKGEQWVERIGSIDVAEKCKINQNVEATKVYYKERQIYTLYMIHQ